VLRWLPAVTPAPTPTSTVDENLVTPGVWGFVAIAAIVVVVILLLIDMTRRVRRLNYRAQVREQLEAEAAAEDAANEPPTA
jgi:uncharacterized protein HemY